MRIRLSTRVRSFVALLVAFAVGPASAQGIITVRAGDGGTATYGPNTTVAVPIVIDMSAAGGQNIAALTTFIRWGATQLRYDSLVAGSFGSVTVNDGNKASGELSLSLLSPTGTTTTVTAATLYFTTFTGSTTVSVWPTAAGNETGGSILPSVRVRWLDACLAGGIWGDANGDGIVNIIDAQQLARASVGLSVQNSAAVATRGDVTNDGAVNILDAQQIARYSVGLSAVARVNSPAFSPPSVASITIPVAYVVNGGSLNVSEPVDFGKFAIGAQAQLRPVARDGSNVDVTACVSLVYSSNASGVAPVLSGGLVDGLAPGVAVISIAAGTTPGVARTTVQFTVKGAYAIAVSANEPAHGSVTGGGTYYNGETVEVKAESNGGGYTFANWTEGQTVVSTTSTYVFTATRPRTLVANFHQVLVSISSPAVNAFASNTLTISATATSTYSIASMTATVSGRSAALTKVGSAWTGTLDLSGLPRDTLVLVVSAIDANGGTGSLPRRIVHDLPPVVVVTSPVNLEVARPSFNYAASCTDDGPAPCTITLEAYSPAGGYPGTWTTLATGTSSISGTASLSAFEGQKITLTFYATGDGGPPSPAIERTIYVQSNPSLSLVGSASGQIVDVKGGRALYRPPTSPDPYSIYTLAIHNFAGGADETIPMPGNYRDYGVLTPAGAIFARYPPPSYITPEIVEWRNGALVSSGLSTFNIDRNETWALLAKAGSPLYRRDLTTGADLLIGPATGTIGSVAADGSVSYTNSVNGDDDIYWYRGGTTTRITNDADAVRVNVAPETDGTNVVYTRYALGTPTRVFETVLFDGTNATVLASRTNGTIYGQDYQVNGGWTAFVKLDASQTLQIWTRSPAGVLRQVSSFFNASVIETLGSDGTVVFTTNNRRYIAGPTGAPKDIGSSEGTAIWRDGEFMVLLGVAALHITP